MYPIENEDLGQQGDSLVKGFDDLSSVPGTHIVKEKNHLLQVDFHRGTMRYMYPHRYNNYNFYIFKKLESLLL